MTRFTVRLSPGDASSDYSIYNCDVQHTAWNVFRTFFPRSQEVEADEGRPS